MSLELISDYNIKPSGSAGYDRVPANYSYFDVSEGKVLIKLQTVFVSGSSINNRTAEPFKNIIFDFVNYKYNMVIYSYYNNYNGIYTSTEHINSPKGTPVSIEFMKISDLLGLNIPTDITPINNAFIKYHIVLKRQRKPKGFTKINGEIKNLIGAYANINGEIKKIIKAVSYKTTPFTIENEINLPFDVPKVDFTYQKYETVISRFNSNNKEVFGRDASDTYDLTCVHIGTKGKPCIFINAGMHGGEFQGVQYSTGFVLDLLNNTFPDVSFRNKIMQNYHLVFIPCLNPWGLNNFGGNYLSTYYNYNKVQLNADFAEGTFTQAESQAFKKLVEKYNPFACLDVHLMSPDYEPSGGKPIVIGNGHVEQDEIKNSIGNTLYNFTGNDVTLWSAQNEGIGLLRAFVARHNNKYNIKTLSYISEIQKAEYPILDNSTGSGIYTNPEIYQIGYLINYLFLKTSIDYFENYKDVKIIETYF